MGRSTLRGSPTAAIVLANTDPHWPTAWLPEENKTGNNRKKKKGVIKRQEEKYDQREILFKTWKNQRSLYWYPCDTSSRLHSLGTADQIPTWRLYLSLERWIQTTMLNNSTMKPTVKVNQKRYIVIPVYCDTFFNFTKGSSWIFSQSRRPRQRRKGSRCSMIAFSSFRETLKTFLRILGTLTLLSTLLRENKRRWVNDLKDSVLYYQLNGYL